MVFGRFVWVQKNKFVIKKIHVVFSCICASNIVLWIWRWLISFSAQFVTILNPVRLFLFLPVNPTVRWSWNLRACKWSCCIQLKFFKSLVDFDWWNCYMEEFYSQVKVRCEIFIDDQAVTFKCSPGFCVDPNESTRGFSWNFESSFCPFGLKTRRTC